MALVDVIRDYLNAQLNPAGRAHTEMLTPDLAPEAFDGNGRLKQSIYVYASTEAHRGPYESSSDQFVHLACYAPTGRAAEALELAIRPLLNGAQLDNRWLRWMDALKATPDDAYSPQELYALGRYRATGLWGTT